MDKLRMKLSALNVNFDGPSLAFLGSRKPAHEGIKERYPRKSLFYHCWPVTAIDFRASREHQLKFLVMYRHHCNIDLRRFQLLTDNKYINIHYTINQWLKQKKTMKQVCPGTLYCCCDTLSNVRSHMNTGSLHIQSLRYILK